ncbi:unnamed protein product, partial [Hapterophycus canaliculatus]
MPCSHTDWPSLQVVILWEWWYPSFSLSGRAIVTLEMKSSIRKVTPLSQHETIRLGSSAAHCCCIASGSSDSRNIPKSGGRLASYIADTVDSAVSRLRATFRRAVKGERTLFVQANHKT